MEENQIQTSGYVILSKALHVLPCVSNDSVIGESHKSGDEKSAKKFGKPIHQTRVVMSDTSKNDETIIFCPTIIKLTNDKYFMVNGTLLLNFSKNKEHVFSTHHEINATVFGGKIIRLSMRSPNNEILEKYDPPRDVLVDIKCNVINSNFEMSVSQNTNMKLVIDALLDMEFVGTIISDD